MRDKIGVAVAGCGVVGSGVVEMLTRNRQIISRAAGREVFLKYMVDLKKLETPEGVTLTQDLDQVLADPQVKVLAETIGGARVAYEYTRRALEKGISVITSNKELVATRGDELKALAQKNGAWYLYEAAVCGGVPVLRPIKTCLAGNRITRLDGIVNGSTNYLLTRMEQSGLSFPAALGEARDLGYVEADPAADIEGWDARRKLAILANAAFGSKLSDDPAISTEGISRLTARDMACARALGGAVKLIAHGELQEDGWTGWVHPALVPQGHPLYDVKDVFNGLCVTGDCVGQVMFYGRGAGMLPTASALMGDLIEIARDLESPLALEPVKPPRLISPMGRTVQAALRVEEGILSLCEAVPVEHVVSLEGMNAVRTQPMPLGQLLAKLDAARGLGIQTGIPLLLL